MRSMPMATEQSGMKNLKPNLNGNLPSWQLPAQDGPQDPGQFRIGLTGSQPGSFPAELVGTRVLGRKWVEGDRKRRPQDGFLWVGEHQEIVGNPCT